ncbi:TetR/AcrR family transcriptional regulator [Rhodococcus sp. P1Y]|uniref:TetR/AcrR family transcriptional regulator n=1 Tax=Rhodococcus sp. P1Y TaxID=1302308 RepID=UPI000EAD00EC|nr:TetR/AcrR family transcriptional regulator [Rhodococcus sp. P1Y]AYJ47759.1 TetR/AcrR family transcriptional regulator [Rhodococcus sp. P1Y]
MDRGDEEHDATVDGRSARWAHRRPELVAAATQYVLDRGVSDLTLRPLASAMGVTIATVVRQFGSKEALVEEITRTINEDLLRTLREDPELVGLTPEQTLRTLWRRWLEPAQGRQFRVLFELFGLAAHHPDQYRWFTGSIVTDWLPQIEAPLIGDGVEPAAARQMATLVLAVLRGLHLDLVATGDVDRVDAAFELAMATLAPALTSPRDAIAR